MIERRKWARRNARRITWRLLQKQLRTCSTVEGTPLRSAGRSAPRLPSPPWQSLTLSSTMPTPLATTPPRYPGFTSIVSQTGAGANRIGVSGNFFLKVVRAQITELIHNRPNYQKLGQLFLVNSRKFYAMPEEVLAAPMHKRRRMQMQMTCGGECGTVHNRPNYQKLDQLFLVNSRKFYAVAWQKKFWLHSHTKGGECGCK